MEELLNKVTCGDCLEVLKQIPDNSVDLVVTDPPYGINLEYNKYIDSQENLKKLIAELMPELFRVSKRIAMTVGINNIMLYPQPKWILNWYNPAGAYMNSWGFTTWQPILVYGSDPYLENSLGGRPDSIKDNSVCDKNNHPCPKPLSFMKKLILRCSVKKTDIILDPFLGSGTTAVAAKQLGRNFIGIEQSLEYCKIAEKRIASVQPLNQKSRLGGWTEKKEEII